MGGAKLLLWLLERRLNVGNGALARVCSEAKSVLARRVGLGLAQACPARYAVRWASPEPPCAQIQEYLSLPQSRQPAMLA